jgi:hypothetical protein
MRKSHHANEGLRPFLDEALNSENGIIMKCGSYGQAINTRHRLNALRVYDRKNSMLIYPTGHPMWGCSIYDSLVLSVPKEGEIGDNCIFIKKEDFSDIKVELIKPDGA